MSLTWDWELRTEDIRTFRTEALFCLCKPCHLSSNQLRRVVGWCWCKSRTGWTPSQLPERSEYQREKNEVREEEESNKYGKILEHPVGRVECSENKISVATHKLTSCLHICRQHVNLCVLMQCFVLWSGFCSQIPDSYSLIHFHSSPGNPSRSSSSCPLSTRWGNRL